MIQTRYQVEELKVFNRAMDEAPVTAAKYVRQALDRGMLKFKATFKKQRLRGRPGIKAGKRLLSSIKTEVSPAGTSLANLQARFYVSTWSQKIWEAHEFGATIQASGGKWLYIRVRRAINLLDWQTGGSYRVAKGRLLRVKRVRIPARLHFYDTWGTYLPTLLPKLEGAAQRALLTVLKGKANAT
ncbi:hypothetical protein [Nitrospira sp. Nam74]